MSHTYSRLLCHVVFSTKCRYPLIGEPMKSRLLSYLGGIVRGMDSTALAINGTADHVHLLVLVSPKVAVSDAIRGLKSNSSKWVHETWQDRSHFAWQIGYGAFSVSSSNQDALLQYIADQEEHHRTRTFQEEFVALLKRHGIEYDERYLWD